MSVDELLSRLRERVTVEEGAPSPPSGGSSGCTSADAGTGSSRRQRRGGAGVESLDVSRLHREVLEPIFGFGEAGDPGLEFVSDAVPVDELTRRVDEDGGAAFTLMPPTFDQFVEVADRHEQMPAKATYFDPKPQSGLFLRIEERTRRSRGPVRQLATAVRASIASDEARSWPPRRCTVSRGCRSASSRFNRSYAAASSGLAPKPVAERDVASFPLAALPGRHGCGTPAPRPRSLLKNSCSSDHGSSAHR